MKKSGNQKSKPIETNRQAQADTKQITIQTPQRGPVLISLVGEWGKVAYEITKEAYGQDLVIDLTGINPQPGMYMVRLTHDQISKVIKIFKK